MRSCKPSPNPDLLRKQLLTFSQAYCGDCAKNRPKKAVSKKDKGKAPASAHPPPFPFKHCVVDGCKEAAAPKNMVRVFIDS